VKIKGFRPGKVPRSLLERRFKKEMLGEVSGQLIQNSYVEAMREAKLAPLGEPALDRPDLEAGQSYHYSATIEVRPPIADLNLKGLRLKEMVHTVEDEEIETQLRILQKRSAQLKTVDDERPVENGDMVLIDYEGFKDGNAFEPAGKTENFLVEVGSGQMLTAFEQQLVGLRVNSTKEFAVQFPEDYYNNDLAGLEVTFRVILKEIKEEILPELDDEFAKDLGTYQTLAEVKDAIREHLEREYEAQSKRQLREDIIDLLIEQHDFELPESLVNEELAAMVRHSQKAMADRGVSSEGSGATEGELFERHRPLAERQVREYLLLQKVIEQEQIPLTDEALEEAYEELARVMNQPVGTIKQFHGQYTDVYETFRQKTIEKQAITRVMEESEIERVKADGGKLEEETKTTPQSP
jgi:trigger factor